MVLLTFGWLFTVSCSLLKLLVSANRVPWIIKIQAMTKTLSRAYMGVKKGTTLRLFRIESPGESSFTRTVPWKPQ